MPQLPNLGAIIFELLEQYLEPLGLDGVADELEKLNRIWAQLATGGRPSRSPNSTAERESDCGRRSRRPDGKLPSERW